MLSEKFSLDESGCLHSAWLRASSLVPFSGNWTLQRELILSTSMAISKTFGFSELEGTAEPVAAVQTLATIPVALGAWTQQ